MPARIMMQKWQEQWSQGTKGRLTMKIKYLDARIAEVSAARAEQLLLTEMPNSVPSPPLYPLFS